LLLNPITTPTAIPATTKRRNARAAHFHLERLLLSSADEPPHNHPDARARKGLYWVADDRNGRKRANIFYVVYHIMRLTY
jgi:hypothetical protein